MPSFEKNKASGLWSCRFREKKDDGTTANMRLSGKFKTKKEAVAAYEDYITKKAELNEKKNHEKELEASPHQMTYDELLKKYLEYRKTRIRESSFYDIEKKIQKNITPFFTGMKIEDITPVTISDWQNTLSRFSHNYRKNLIALVSSIFLFAERYYDIKNIAKKVEAPRRLKRKAKMLCWSPEEFEAAMKQDMEEKYRVFFTFLYFSGCREGEAFALSWNDIDLKRGKVNIDKSLTRKAHEEGKSYKITAPKNDASYREISIPSDLCRLLEEYKKTQEDGVRFVFGGDHPLARTTCERRLTIAANNAGVKRIRIHDLRHSCATLLIHKKVSIVTVSEHLGHSDVEQTLNTYAHALPDDRDELISVLSGIAKNMI